MRTREQLRQYARDYYKKNKEILMQKQRDSLADPERREKRKAYYRAYAKRNRDKYAARKRARRAKDPGSRMADSIRMRLRTVVKFGSTLEGLGCSWQELKVYLESKFLPDMSWDNYGRYGWHIDHIRPLSSFDLTIPSQYAQAVHHSNLQPMWAHDNHVKYNKWSK